MASSILENSKRTKDMGRVVSSGRTEESMRVNGQMVNRVGSATTAIIKARRRKGRGWTVSVRSGSNDMKAF